MDMRICPTCDLDVDEYESRYCGMCDKQLSEQKYIWCNNDDEGTHFCSAACMRKYYTELIRDSKVELS